MALPDITALQQLAQLQQETYRDEQLIRAFDERYYGGKNPYLSVWNDPFPGFTVAEYAKSYRVPIGVAFQAVLAQALEKQRKIAAQIAYLQKRNRNWSDWKTQGFPGY